MSNYKNGARIVIRLTLILMLFSALGLTNLTRISAQQNESSAPRAQPTPPVNELEQCSQMLDKKLDEVAACKILAQNRLIEIEGFKALTDSLRQEIVRLNKIVLDADERIAILQKQKCSQISFFFGLIKIRQC